MPDFDQITTRGGDRGDSSLYNGERRGKDEPVFEALGDIDELSSWLGLLKNRLFEAARSEEASVLEGIQKRLVLMGGEVATPRSAPLFHRIEHLTEEDTLWLEETEHALLQVTSIPPRFVLPGKTELSAWTDIARSTCRRAERSMVRCIRKEGMIHLTESQHFLNRLSDYLFILARKLES
jgi:cob(I)alamin adenosyltransferase